MTSCRGMLIALALCGSADVHVRAQEPWRVNPPGQRPDDARLKPLRNLRDEYHPWTPPTARAAWDRESQRIREQLLVACGLWPLPERTPLEPVIHGVIDRGDYTVSKVYFASRPGHYVTGNLYQPKTIDGPIPGVLCPHGHWSNGRFYDAGPDAAATQLASGAEDFLSGARFPLQARMVQLARMGCIVFHYDMVGYADSQAVEHRAGFNDVDAELWMDNKLGLQTWNSIRALDFLESLPDVDPDRIGVTGASGGGTQTFMLCAIDPRPAVAFPAVMVSTGMQGGCVCENASYLRIGINNVAIAALCAPRPMAMSGANDWTIRIETRGLPELKQVYSFYDASDLVNAHAWPEFPHNYNQRSREMMFNWFNEHLGLGLEEPVEQRDFWPIPPEELAVFDEGHPPPDDALDAQTLRAELRQKHRNWFQDLIPESAADVEEYRRVIGPAARVMLDPEPAARNGATIGNVIEQQLGRYVVHKTNCGRRGTGEHVPVIAVAPPDFNGTVVLWFHPAGKRHLFDADGELLLAAERLLDAGIALVSADLFGTGEFVDGDEEYVMQVDAGFPGYTYCYNRPLLTERVRDILTVLAVARERDDIQQIHLVGTGEAGPWVLLARAVAGDEKLDRTLVDLEHFNFGRVTDVADPMLLPGALRYGNIDGLAALAAPGPLVVYGANDDGLATLRHIYDVTGGNLETGSRSLAPDDVADGLLRLAD